MQKDLFGAFRDAIQQNAQQWVVPYEKPVGDSAHQFVLFLKPEATALHENVDLEGVHKLVLERLIAFEATVHSVRVLPGSYLDRHAIMDQHYGVINRISKQGESALAPAALEKLRREFSEDLENGAIVMGGHQFLKEHPSFSPLALSTLNDNLGTTKLAGGSYCMRLVLQGKVYLLLNPFHAYQLVPFTTSGRAIIVMECRSSRDWKELREDLTGATDPEKATPGSIRAELLRRKDELNLREVNQGSNGVHLSAGPLEGMVELQRFFTDHESGDALDWGDTLFGSQLLDAGKSREDVSALAENPILDADGASEPAFDLTEEINADQALRLLA